MTSINRKQIAGAAKVSEKTVARHEKKWGLQSCRNNSIERPILYFRAQANQELIRRGIISEPI